MKNLLFTALLFIALPSYAIPPECKLDAFPTFWTDTQDRVEKLKFLLGAAERSSPYSAASAMPFRQALGICAAKRKHIFNDPNASGGTVTQMKCEAVLICARIAAIEM